jgi:putative glutamine amidotransferase
MHHQGIKALGRTLAAAATAPDGLIEAIESSDDSFLVGVQWHPEVFEATDPHTEHLFSEFLEAARRASRRGR